MNNPIEKAMEITGLSAERIAELLEVSKTTINNYRKNPGAMGIAELNKLSQETGISLDILIGGNSQISGPKLSTVYSKSAEKIEKALKYAESHIGDIENINIDDKYKLAKEEQSIALAQYKDIIGNTRINGRKPLVGALGPSDSGKSTLMNYLLGMSIIPASYTPVTTVPTYIMHISERPDVFEDNADNAIVYGRTADSSKVKFSHEMLYDKEKAGKYVIRKGNYESILKDFGTRNGAYYENETWYIDEIDIYVDSDILKEVTLVDFPGFGTGDRKEDDVSLTMDLRKFDFIFLLSPADGFQRAAEAGAFLDVLRSVSGGDSKDNIEGDLGRVFFLATHCNSIGDPGKVEEILHRGCGRLVKMMSESEKERFGIDEDNFAILENRFFGFENTVKYFCEKLNKDIEKNFPIFSRRKVEASLRSLNKICGELDDKYQEELKRVQKGKANASGQKADKKLSGDFIKNAETSLKESKRNLKISANNHKTKSESEMRNGYERTIEADNIKRIIEKKDLKNRKADIETLVNYLSAELEDTMSASLQKHGDLFAEEVNKEIANYKQNVNKELKDIGADVDMNGFDFTRAFASGLTGMFTFGALAFWVTVVATGSSAGSYFVASSVISSFTAAGVSLWGTGAALSATAALGGPVTIGIVLSILAAVAVYGVFTGTWKARVAARIVKEYEKNGVLSKYIEYIDGYWDDTNEAIVKCFDELNNQTIKYYEAATKMDDMNDEEKITSGILLEQLFKRLSEIYGEMSVITRLKENDE